MSFLGLLPLGTTLTTSVSYVITTFVSLFVMVDPFAAIPVYLVLTERFTHSDVKKTRRKGVSIALCILLVFSVAGVGVLNFFGISIAALRIAGGLLLLKFSIEQMGGRPEKIHGDEEIESLQRDQVAIVPLSMPILAGPGAISTIIVQTTRATNWFYIILLILSLVLVMWVTYLCLKYSRYLYHLLGKTGLNLLGRIMGILVAAIAVEFILTGLRESFHGLSGI